MAGNWPLRRTTILDWLVGGTRDERFLDNIFVEFCARLRADGIMIARATLHLRIHHPQWSGASFLWKPGMAEAKLQRIDYQTMETPQFLNSPIKALYDGSNEVRTLLDAMDTDDEDAFPIYADLRRQGYTDYVVWPMDFTQGQRHVVSFASDRPGGFVGEELALLADLLPALALVTEIRLKNRFARTLLETYVGPHASEQILAGATRRGSGVTVSAVILICDLRGFTSISELWPRDDVISLLNDYFDAMSVPIERHGGEILKFIGDGMLAIFPLDKPEACADALMAVTEARLAMKELNVDRATRGLDPLGYGVGIHVGDVMYGNIGSRSRLDFTVIGPAVNVAARLESLTKEVHRNVLFSGAFVTMAQCAMGLDPMGRYPLRGVGEPVEVYALKEQAGDPPPP
ncbi:adenylate/guanylate cyclase domain-containing protein [Lichenihabitans psoromatis]|uniref:adenylate/guanylate cyclase domain-containing protein n=1 Tax=Lichenihabitans psoromatis TaxID=2528642 RepID=UPI001FDECB1A|nr:adenylate/guanylate cyclase domain-containing protein [Lichenihabitans psoromatis]